MAETAPGVAADALLEIAPRLGRLLTSALESRDEPRLTLRQFRILQRLAQRPHRSGELASSTGVSAATMSVAVATLETQGWIERQADPADRRAAIVRITPSGRRAFSDARQHLRKLLITVSADLDDSDAQALTRLRDPLNAGIDRARSAMRQASATPRAHPQGPRETQGS
ncbi:MAG: MarR family transcriptional regulator [Actinomycetota bacterium]|jgi:DNA-binding MarR family transcriptional regulator|nr:MarR family transcriptional regulator [Actinomycetota bacterium]